jgi:hypothetical protein
MVFFHLTWFRLVYEHKCIEGTNILALLTWRASDLWTLDSSLSIQEHCVRFEVLMMAPRVWSSLEYDARLTSLP